MTILNVEQVAEMFGITCRQVRLWAKQGRLPAVRVGRRWYFESDALRTLWSNRDVREEGNSADGTQ